MADEGVPLKDYVDQRIADVRLDIEHQIGALRDATSAFNERSSTDRAALHSDIGALRTEIAVVSNSTASARVEAADAKNNTRANVALIISGVVGVASLVLAFFRH